MRITSNGLVSIGATNGSAKLEVAGTGANNSGANATYEGTIKINEAGAFNLQTTGGLEFKGSVFGSGYGSKIFSTDAGDLLFGNRANSATWSERMRIDSSGNVLVGTTGDYGGLSSKCIIQPSFGTGTTLFVNTYSNTGTALSFYSNISGAPNAAGSITLNAGSTAYNTSSDYRLKENVAPMTGALETVAKLKPVTYKWKIDGSDGQGFIAHELQEVVPDCVTGEKDAVNEDGSIKPQGIDTSFLVATLTAAIQEQQVMIETLTTRLNALEGK
jgi:hypothetical protein